MKQIIYKYRKVIPFIPIIGIILTPIYHLKYRDVLSKWYIFFPSIVVQTITSYEIYLLIKNFL